MFGYVVANVEKLTDEQREIYQAVYCGLCTELGKRHGQISRTTLTYDMSFLILLLSSLSDEEPVFENFRCAVHPLKKRKAFISAYTPYAADINIILAHAQRLDSWEDDRNVLSLSQAKMLENASREAEKPYPRQVKVIKDALGALSLMEKDDVTNPDLPASAFGQMLGEIFVPLEDMPQARELYDLGFTLGRFIYMMDAVLDLKDDIKKKRYNPLITIPSSQHEEILRLQMAQCAACFERLNVPRNKDLLENILYSGVWTSYAARNRREAAQS